MDFVNSNKPNFKFHIPSTLVNLNCDVLERYNAKFESEIQYDDIDDHCFPVIVYKRNDELIAWYDVENLCGYTKQGA